MIASGRGDRLLVRIVSSCSPRAILGLYRPNDRARLHRREAGESSSNAKTSASTFRSPGANPERATQQRSTS
jgi:hypothetical protein